MEEPTQDKIITLEQYYDPMLAHIMRTKLEDNDIPCFIADDNIISANPVFNNAVGGIKLKIFERDLQRSRELLAQQGNLHEQDHFEIDEETHAPVICPYCASTNVRYGAATERKAHWLITLISALLSVLPFYTRKAWHCFNCQRDFE
ncbi:putative signal transducing protein [Mucilaginibacter phyllosphaerae]|uniref:DUF2007 domain-containing protein n=1 Tax=Mucilaginibacter phyllosphaerae TaxID=1812349 RepID=A0A4Y8AHV9_9SPHI|nr:DUF2007 domain-containing protein [Mucilaginibacter phyllosphaerae]MBB3968334.1 hypothetical protein [Mucilaginibacter phyllosphaerae]TEW68667.1 DUF2007 domain-containing protein [Mucilaginibacter phyllosphaerae]GGG99644.1 hypothetical protein GCM10007352_00590 [Mucilaginibacter phyllosphaerae]